MMWVHTTITVANSGIATTDVATITHTTSNNHIRAVFDGETDLNATITVIASDGFSQGTGTIVITIDITMRKIVNSQEN